MSEHDNEPFVQVIEPVSSYRKRAGYRFDEGDEVIWFFDFPEDYDEKVWPIA